MSTLTDLRDQHIVKATQEWDNSVLSTRYYLTYDRAREHGEQFKDPVYVAEDAAVRALTKRFFTVAPHVLWEALGSSLDEEKHCYSHMHTYTLLDLMDFLSFFIGHELLDDGFPGIGYYRHLPMNERTSRSNYVRCSKTHPKAIPFFHSNADVMRDTETYDEKPEHLDLDNALKVLNLLEIKHVKFEAQLRALKEQMGWEPEEPGHTEQNLRTAFVEELIALGAPDVL